MIAAIISVILFLLVAKYNARHSGVEDKRLQVSVVNIMFLIPAASFSATYLESVFPQYSGFFFKMVVGGVLAVIGVYLSKVTRAKI